MNDSLTNEYVTVRPCRHGLFAYNTAHMVGQIMDAYGEWAEAEIELLGQAIDENSIVVDAGAYIGTHTVPFARLARMVVAFEPQRLAYQLLCGNAALNGLINVHAFNAALGAAPGTLSIPLLDPAVPNNPAALPAEGHDHGDTIAVMTIDGLGLPGCDLIKIDVEGMELQVIWGAERTIRLYRPILFVENNHPEQSAALVDALDKLDYRCWWHIYNGFNPANWRGNPENILAGLMPEVNILCVHRSVRADVDLPPVEPGQTWQEVAGEINRRIELLTSV